MKVVFWVVALFALAVGLVVAARYNDGYVLLVLPPWRVEIALNLLVIVLIAAFVLIYSLVRIAGSAAQMPARVRQYRLARRRDKAQEALTAALEAYFEGRYAHAEQAATRSIALGEHKRLATVIAARAAHALSAYDRSDRYLRDLAESGSESDALRSATEAALQSAGQRAPEPLAGKLESPHWPATIDRT
jgi:HemY protein